VSYARELGVEQDVVDTRGHEFVVIENREQEARGAASQP
jgi:hypothetical protein